MISGKPTVKDSIMQKIQLATDIETIEANVASLEKLLGIPSLHVKYDPHIVFDLHHLAIQSEVAFLAYIFEQLKKAPNSTFKKNFRMRLKSFPKFFDSDTFVEYLEKCITVILLSGIVDNWNDLKEEQEIHNKKLDLAFISDEDRVFVEVSRITESHYSKLIRKYDQQYFSKIDSKEYNPIPLYFEVVFTKEPSEEVLKSIVTKLEELMKINIFPTIVRVNEHYEIYIDTLEARLKEKQIVRENLDSLSYLKSLRLNGIEGKWYALAYQFDYKSIVNKISEEVKEHALEKLNNIWVSLHVPMKLLDELENDENKMNIVKAFLSKVEGLQGLLLFNISLGSISEVSYLVLSQ